ncbi:Nif3-like dinuclear metal center hexameric protein [uncultured Demequina sp.]|uniref:Nif3-like dinuclear metal center hexameric protein n=1 Tax=uncultured Demequina sp. TaxID=693499 RepID=UPI00260055B9|nr:Nif3-like dinuclear metal center hexameric protein [uncultured Demequina sp.]
MATVADIAEILEFRFDPALAEGWDVNGLSVGDPRATVERVLFAVDPTLAVVEEAIDAGAQLIVTHHPLMLRGVTSVAATTAKGAVVHRAISAGIALYNAHTNADAAAGGVCDALAAALGIESTVPLVPAEDDGSVGSGRLGVLAGPLPLRDFAERVAEALPQTHHGVRVAGDLDAVITTVAVVGGAGDSFLALVQSAGADAYVTADLRHHPALDARELAEIGDGRPHLVDVSHYASEWLWLKETAEHVADAAGIDAIVSTLSTDPWTARFGA